MQKLLFRFFSCCFLLTAGSSPISVAGDFSFGGYIKSYLFLFDPPAVRDASGIGIDASVEAQWSNRLRLQASYNPRPWMRLDGAYDLAPRVQSERLSGNSLFFARIDPFTYRAIDLDSSLYPSETGTDRRFALGQNLDRASITLRSRRVDFTIGRQAIAWGSARVVNPTDVLAPFSFETLDTEDRIGIDAVRARIPLGTLSEIDAGYVFGKDLEFSSSAFYARTGFNAAHSDISLMVMGFRENLLFGFDLARAIGKAGYWLETAYVLADALDGDSAVPNEDYFRASTGVDYSFAGNTYGFIEYHFNGAGTARPGDYIKQYAESAYSEGSVYLMGRHYLIPGLSCQYHPLVTLTLQSLINMTDPSVFLAPRLEYNIASGFYLGAGAFVGIGKKPLITDLLQPVVLGSEFGGYPNVYFASLNHYF